jgi:hypothetical protein
MSAATKEILGRVRQLIPPMLDKFHKGKCIYRLSRASILSILLSRSPGGAVETEQGRLQGIFEL